MTAGAKQYHSLMTVVLCNTSVSLGIGDGDHAAQDTTDASGGVIWCLQLQLCYSVAQKTVGAK